MVIHKIHKGKSREHKGNQQIQMVYDCKYHWKKLNNKDYQIYNDIMNMKTSRWDNVNRGSIALTYHIKLNKW